MNDKAIPSMWGVLPHQHCCHTMDYGTTDITVPLQYIPVLREYRLQNTEKPYTSYIITYCPWCGTQLPKSLRATWFATLKTEYGLKPHIDMLYSPELPEEFKSDAWWKKRNI